MFGEGRTGCVVLDPGMLAYLKLKWYILRSSYVLRAIPIENTC